MRKIKQTNAAKAEQLLYLTSDQCVYMDEAQAQKHARKLEDKTVTTLTQKEAEAQLEALNKGADTDEQTEDVMWLEA